MFRGFDEGKRVEKVKNSTRTSKCHEFSATVPERPKNLIEAGKLGSL